MIPKWSQKCSKSEPGAPWGDLGLKKAPESVLDAFPGEAPTPNYTICCASGVILRLFGGMFWPKKRFSLGFCLQHTFLTFSGAIVEGLNM